MKKVTCFYLEECPYCRQARRVIDDLIAEDPAYGEVEIEWIEENEHPEIIENYNYQATPTMFIGDDKMYEAHLFESYDECREHVMATLDAAMK